MRRSFLICNNLPGETQFLKRFKLWLSWLPLVLFLWICLQFLEGPPYREIVRSWSFVTLVGSVSLLGCEVLFLRKCRRHLSFLSIIYVLITAGGFLYTIQHYYHGGKNPAYFWWLVVWSSIFFIHLIAYMFGLLRPKPVQRFLGNGEGCSDDCLRYQMVLYSLSSEGKRKGVAYQTEGEHPLPQSIALDGYSQNQVIDLAPYWQEMEEQRLGVLCKRVTVYETIIKFGKPMQLVDVYELNIRCF